MGLYIMNEIEYKHRVDTVDECVQFLVDIVASNIDDYMTKLQMFEYYKRAALNTFRDAYERYLTSYK